MVNSPDLETNSSIYETARPIVKGIAKATVYLIENQNDDGGWGEVTTDPTDVFPTYLGIWALCEVGLHNSEWNLRALQLFEENRTTEGCWGAHFSGYRVIDPTVRGLLSRFRYMLFEGNFELSKKDVRAIDFILLSQNRDGSWPRDTSGDYKGSPGVTLNPQGDVGATLPYIDLLCMIPDEHRLPDMKVALTRALDWITSLRNEDGGCGHMLATNSDVLATAWALRALCTCPRVEHTEIVDSYSQYLLKKQRGHGGWCEARKRKGNIIYTYNTVHSLALSGLNLYHSNLRAGVNWLLNQQRANGSWLVAEEKSSIQYTASLILVLSRVLKAHPQTAILTDLISTALSNGSQVKTASMVIISSRHKLYMSRRVFFVFMALALIVSYFVVPPFVTFLVNFWNSLDQKARDVIVYSVILAIITNIIASFIFERMRKRKGNPNE